MAVKEKYFIVFFIFSGLVFGGAGFGENEQKRDSSEQSLQKKIEYRIITKNEFLSENLNRYFENKPISKKGIQKFLIEKSYYQAEIVKEGTAYFVKNPVQIVFVFKGNRFFNDKELRKLIKIDENKAGSFFYSFVENAIKKAYQSEGFLNIEVEKKTFKRDWKKWIHLNLSEGPRIKIAELRVRGLLSKPDSQYQDFIRNNSTDLIKKGFYNKKDLETGYENLINHLKSQGYLQSKIYSDRIFFEGDKAFITINLEEGPLTLIRDIQIKNAQALPTWEILSHIKSRAQSPLKIDILKSDLNSIEQLYKSKGYLNMKITNKADVVKYVQGEKYASVMIQVEEGSKAFVSEITVKGLQRAEEEMVRRLLKFKAGDILTPEKKEQSLRALGETGLWTDISLNEQWTDDEFEVEFLFKERKPRFVRGGFGVNSQRGLTTRAYSEIAHRNLFGWGRALIAKGSGQISLAQINPFLEYEISGRYKEVFVPGYGYQGDINLSHSKNVFRYSKSSTDDIKFVFKTQLSFFINKEISKDLKTRWNVLSFENRREACTQTQTVCPENLQRIGSTGFKMVWDKRDNIFDPSSGYLNSLTIEWVAPFLGSSPDISFLKADFQNQFYYSFIKNYTLGLTLKGGMIQAIQDSSSIPVSRAFILGGQNSVRGYDGHIEGERIPEKKYAPIETANEALTLKQGDFKENVLNSAYALINTDFRFPILEGFKGGLFYDLGLVYMGGQNETVVDYGHSAGLGFRYQTFLIPIGLDIAYRLPPKKDVGLRLHFSIGW